MNNIEIGANIRRLRLARSMTQEQLAQRLNLTPQAVSKWENGASLPDVQLLPELSVLLGVTIDGLFALADGARFDRIEAMLEDVRFLPDEEFDRTLRWLRDKRQESAAKPRATLLLAQLLNKRADEYHALAAPLAREALALNPDEKEAHNAVFGAEKGVWTDWYAVNHCRLIDFYKQVVAGRPDDWRGYMYLLDLLVADRRLDEARDYAARLRAVRDDWRCENVMGEIALAACDLPGALDWWARMTARAPQDWLPWAVYGDNMAKLARWDAALAAHEKAMALREKPRFVDCEETVARIHEVLGDYPAAAQTHRRIIEIMREDWNVTEGEGVDVHWREIERLEGVGRRE